MAEQLHSVADARRFLESFLHTSARYFGLPMPQSLALARERTRQTPGPQNHVPVQQSPARTPLAAQKNALRHLGPCEPGVFRMEERHQWIRKVAYYKAMSRRFIPGHELLDWLAAEREVDALCGHLSES